MAVWVARPEVRELRVLVEEFFDVQKMRVGVENRLKRYHELAREHIPDAEQRNGFLEFLRREEELLNVLKREERRLRREISMRVSEHPLWREYLQFVRGIGEPLAGQFIAMIGDISRFPNVSRLWRFSGWGVVDGRAERKERGKRASFNPKLKRVTWNMGRGLLMAKRYGGVYYLFYRKYREQYEERARHVRVALRGDALATAMQVVTKSAEVVQEAYDPDGKSWTAIVRLPEFTRVPDFVREIRRRGGEAEPMLRNPTAPHIHQMALRKMIKLFLAHIWQAWRQIEGLPIAPPYAIEHLKHGDFVPPLADVNGWVWCRERFCDGCPLRTVCDPERVAAEISSMRERYLGK